MTSELDKLLASKPESSHREVAGRPKVPRREALVRLIPFALIGAFAVTLIALYGEHLYPSVPVSVVTPVVTAGDTREGALDRGSGSGGVDSPQALFQSSGWIEADPFPYRAYALASGVVERVLVLEGESVEAGQTLATLVEEDARLDLTAAEASLAQAESELQSIASELDSLEHEYQLAVARVAVEESKADELRDVADRMSKLSDGAVAEQDITQAQLKLATQLATVESAKKMVLAAGSRREQGQARLSVRQAMVAHARNELARAQLNLERMCIRAPVSGVIQRLMAAPGGKKMLASDMTDSHVVALIFDPEKLQARIDVPLEEASKLEIGQPVKVRTGLLSQRTFEGEVTRIVGEADLQRNTLQVKVRILDPDPALRPDMLCRGEFFAKPTGSSGVQHSEGGGLDLFLPAKAVLTQDGQSRVWRVSADRKHVELVVVKVMEGRDTNHLRIVSGLAPGDPVVLDPPPELKAGSRIRIIQNQNL